MPEVLLRATIFTLQSVNYLQRIVNAINDKHRKLNNDWDQALSYASGELKRRADPLRTVDLGANVIDRSKIHFNTHYFL